MTDLVKQLTKKQPSNKFVQPNIAVIYDEIVTNHNTYGHLKGGETAYQSAMNRMKSVSKNKDDFFFDVVNATNSLGATWVGWEKYDKAIDIFTNNGI